jgi:putative transposase
MPWIPATREHYERDDLQQASDLRDAEWAAIAPLLPPPAARGRPRTTDLRAVVEALLFLLATGCQWRALPRGPYPPFTTVQTYFYAWRRTGTWTSLREILVGRERVAQGRAEAPTAGVIDTQSVPATESGGLRGLDPAKRIKGRKRHVVTDTHGLPLAVAVQAASVQDVHGAVPVLVAAGTRWPGLRHVFADRVYRGRGLLDALARAGQEGWTVAIVQRPPGVKGFALLPRRWVIERTFAWLNRCRRLAKSHERLAVNEEAWIELATIRLLARRLARHTKQETAPI